MIALISATLLSLILFLVFGLLTSRLLKSTFSIHDSLLVGLVVSNSLTTWLSLFFPINDVVLMCFVTFCLWGLYYLRGDLKNIIALASSRRSLVICSFLFLPVIFLLSLSAPKNFDTGLYHIQAIKWIIEYPAVPGLANLHGRLGFNPNIFTLHALTSLYGFFNREVFSINYALFLILVFYYIGRMLTLYKQEGLSALFAFYLFVFIILIKSTNFSSPSPDFLSIYIPLYVFCRIIDWSSASTKKQFENYIPLFILCSYVITVKLATIPILLLFVFIFFQTRVDFNKSIRLMLFLSLIIIPWLCRNIILTGWILYPFSSLNLFSFDWTVPVQHVIDQKNTVTGWARLPGTGYLEASGMAVMQWFPAWWKTLYLTHKLFVPISIIAPLMIFAGQLSKKIKANLLTNAVVVTSYIGVIFWFFMAPDWRFGESFIMIATLSPLLVFKSIHFNPGSRLNLVLDRLHSKNKIVPISLLILILLFLTKKNYPELKDNLSKVLSFELALLPERVIIPENVTFKTIKISGVDVRVPEIGARCFDCEIPCTPYPDSSIVLRKNTLSSGFRFVKK